jgi:hypothetical protein
MLGGVLRSFCLFLFCCLATHAVATDALPTPVDESGKLDGRWSVAGVPKQRMPLTRFSAVSLDGRRALRVDVQSSYANLVHTLSAASAAATLAWSWRLDTPNPKADLKTKGGDDVALRVCLSFDLPLDRLGFFERESLLIARSASAQALPTATLCYVWDSHLAPGTVLTNAYTRRVRYIVLRGPADGLAAWVDERRNIAADWHRAFGDESLEAPPLTAVMVGGDGDNTQMKSLAFVADLRLLP